MKESTSTEGTDREKSNEPGMHQTLKLAAAVAMLGMSVGVNVQELLASGPSEILQSNQEKLGGIQQKDRAGQMRVPAIQDKGVMTQQKIDAVQDKQLVRPEMKPVNPAR